MRVPAGGCEVISGFRLHYGGYGESVGVRPDLVTLGKIIGGGMPLGALLGPARIMQRLAPQGDVYQAGTLSGNPISLAAGIATLQLIRDNDPYASLERLGTAFDEALAPFAKRVPFIRWRRVGSVIWLHLAPGESPRAAPQISAAAVERFNAVHAPLLDQGYYLPPSAYEVLFLSTAHGSDEVCGLARALGTLLEAAATL